MVRINLIGFKQFEQTLKKLPVNLVKETEAEIRFSAEEFRDLAIKDAPADVGFLRSQITVKKGSGLSFEVVSGSKYSAPMEFGTKLKFTPIPGIDAGEFKGQPAGGTFKEFLGNIRNWTLRKGIPPIASYPIARSILRKGVTPHPYFFKQIPIVRRDFFRRYRNVLNSVMD